MSTDHASGQPTTATDVSESVNGHDGGKPDVTNYEANQRQVSKPDLTTAVAPNAASSEPTTSVDLSTSVREEEVDPFSHQPRYTKWDYIKV